MGTIHKLVETLHLGMELGNAEIVREAIIELGRTQGLVLGEFDIKKFNTPSLQSLLETEGSMVAWIKLFRELTRGMKVPGEFLGLKESKDEYERRKCLLDKW